MNNENDYLTKKKKDAVSNLTENGINVLNFLSSGVPHHEHQLHRHKHHRYHFVWERQKEKEIESNAARAC